LAVEFGERAGAAHLLIFTSTSRVAPGSLWFFFSEFIMIIILAGGKN
jgi:hypothetical protein